MFEFDTVSSSSATDLARSLTQRSADGWEVVSIVGSALEMTAFLRRPSRTAAGATDAGAAVGSTAAAHATPLGSTVTSSTEEPAGWGTVPTTASTTDDGWGSRSASTEPSPAASAAAATASTATSASTSTNTVPQVPAGWYADPAGRYELRYWDGAQWTEHVARGGTQYTDPPVA